MPSTVAESNRGASAPSSSSPETLRVEGHVDPSSGNIDTPGGVHVGGNVVDLFQLRCGGRAHVGGVIEAASVVVGGDLTAVGGISGKERGQCRVGGDVRGRYITNATVEAVGDVVLETELCNSRLICQGDLRLESGAIVGGHATVLGSVACQSAGSPGGTAATLIELGVFEALRRLAATSVPQVERLRREVEKVRMNAAPLIKNQKHLTSAQKEQVTEMLFEADGLDEQINDLMSKLRDGWNTWRSVPPAELCVKGVLHAGVTVRFPGLQATIDAAVRGPLRLVTRASGGQKYVSLIEDGKEGGHPLPTRAWADPVMENLAKTLQ